MDEVAWKIAISRLENKPEGAATAIEVRSFSYLDDGCADSVTKSSISAGSGESAGESFEACVHQLFDANDMMLVWMLRGIANALTFYKDDSLPIPNKIKRLLLNWVAIEDVPAESSTPDEQSSEKAGE
jgi:hypothetical protein